MPLWDRITWLFRPEPRRPLAHRQPARAPGPQEDVPLGLEAVDLSQIDAVNRRNASLERVNTFHAPFRTQKYSLEGAETAVATLPDDETYAARYHRAYNRKEGKTP